MDLLSERFLEKSSPNGQIRPVRMLAWDIILFHEGSLGWGFSYEMKGVSGVFHTGRVDFVSKKGVATDIQGKRYLMTTPLHMLRQEWYDLTLHQGLSWPSALGLMVLARQVEEEYAKS